jgi:ribosome-associated heat shock protein Hsp15
MSSEVNPVQHEENRRAGGGKPPGVRLDVWLDVACLFRTRSEAQKACKGGKVDVNGQSAKPHRDIRPGDEILITRPLGRRQRVVVRALADKHIARAMARELYEDVTPPPSPAEVEMRRLERLARSMTRVTTGAPDKRERRQLRRMKEGRRQP